MFADTRPEAIKVISVMQTLRAAHDHFGISLCLVGQLREMLMWDSPTSAGCRVRLST
jgi:UDP-N-acetylglucosamine 2-epimerase